MNDDDDSNKDWMFESGRDAAERKENARLKVAYQNGKCFVLGCDRNAKREFPDADNDFRPFLTCEIHYRQAKEKRRKIEEEEEVEAWS